MEQERLLEIIKLLIKKYVENNQTIQFEPEFIESILFTPKADGTKIINNTIFYILRANQIDMKGVSFDHVHISGYYFNGLKNVEINIQQIPNSDISETNLKGVTITGSLDGAYIRGTKFKGYIGNLILDPQKVQNKDLYFCDLSGITINGSFDNTIITMINFNGSKGKIQINPQKIQNKDLSGIKFKRVEFIGDYNPQTGNYSKPCFDNCCLNNTDFTGYLGEVEINPQNLKQKSLTLSDVTGVKFINTFDGVFLYHTTMKDHNGTIIYLDKVIQDDQSISKETISSSKKKSPKRKILSFRKKSL